MPLLGSWRTLPDYVVHHYEVHEQTVHTSKDTAAVLTLATQRATVLGQDRSDRFVLSDTWLRGNDVSWRVWRRHSTPASRMALPQGWGGRGALTGRTPGVGAANRTKPTSRAATFAG